ncbi:PREDICTED: JINGUBANG [Prunus dulcis]|uniref:PREDICTED: JINGUBANG n=1 Tax=Prunus dulcis TaxID=3755 RepID=A0A5E4G612_PRUDU|nr:PREDICTED: JINGUBANG [Prunus dulcis]
MEYAQSMSGKPYGYHNMMFSWIDTMADNYPPRLDTHLVVSMRTSMQPAYAANMWNEALNKRLEIVHWPDNEEEPGRLEQHMKHMDILNEYLEATPLTIYYATQVAGSGSWTSGIMDKFYIHYLEASTSSSSSLSSQPNLPSVPSLTPSFSNQLELVLQFPTTHHLCIATLKTQPSSYVCTLALSGNFLYSGSSNGQIIAWSRSHSSSPNKVVAPTNSTVKSSGRWGATIQCSPRPQNPSLENRHQCHHKTTPSHKKHFKCIATLPALQDRFPRFFSPKDNVPIRRHKNCASVSALAKSNDTRSWKKYLS